MNRMILHQGQLAVFGILLSATLWGIMWYPMRLFDQAGLPGVWTTLLMYSAAALASLPAALKSWRREAFSVELMLLAMAAGATNLAVLAAVIEGEVMRVMLLFFLSPLWSVLISRIWLGERISMQAAVLLVLAMSGTVMMLWQPDMGAPWPDSRADALALFAGMMFSLHNVISRKLAQVPTAMKTCVVFWGVVLVCTVVLLWSTPGLPEAGLHIWLAAPLLGGSMIIIMTISVLFGLAHMPVYRSAVLMLFQLVVAAVSAWLLTDERMSLAEWCGGLLIMASAYGIARLAHR